MGKITSVTLEMRRWPALLLSAFLAVAMLAITAQTLLAQEAPEEPLNIETSEKTVNQDTARPGETLRYSVIVRNSSNNPGFGIFMTDTVPVGLTVLTNTVEFVGGVGVISATEDTVLWNGAINPDSQVTVNFQAQLSQSLAHDDVITNTAVIAGSGLVISRTAATVIVTDTYRLFMPLMNRPLPVPQLSQLGRTSSDNKWTLGWSVANSGQLTGYELEESQRSDFRSATTIDIPGSGTSQIQRSLAATFKNEYFYRIRSVGPKGKSVWSNVVNVLANYRDNFDDPASDWQVRRMTYLERTYAKYDAGQMVILVDDKWDWLVASPLVRAPSPPYVIEFRARLNDPANLVSGGPVVGGDWNGDPCPEIGNVYETDNCFNQFYNFNQIFFGPLKLLFERVDSLVWCPSCGTSPLKRLGDIGNTWLPYDILENGQATNWHIYRIEVRDSGIQYYIDSQFKGGFADSTYVNRPYFGVFASTDEYKPSIWLYDWYAVSYLD